MAEACVPGARRTGCLRPKTAARTADIEGHCTGKEPDVLHPTRWMRQFTIRARMTGIVGVVLGLLASVGAAAVAGMVRIQDSTDRFIDGTFAVSVKASHLREALGRVRRAEQELLARYEVMDSLEGPVADWRKAVVAAQQEAGGLAADRADPGTDMALQGLQRYHSGFVAALEKMRSGALTASNVPAVLKPLDGELDNAAKALDTLNASLLREAEAARGDQRALMRSTLAWFGLTL
ncbi:MAG TPA: hypothetical protein VLE45_15585, partial [Burkholderiaceae bacterium]|nr:hypothetical protein [Burkholderiaceae bacterium]